MSVSLNQPHSELKYHSTYLSYLSQFGNKPQSTFQHTTNKKKKHGRTTYITHKVFSLPNYTIINLLILFSTHTHSMLILNPKGFLYLIYIL